MVQKKNSIPGEVYADANALAQVIQTLVDDAEFGFGERQDNS